MRIRILKLFVYFFVIVGIFSFVSAQLENAGGDFDGDGNINLNDGVDLLNNLFQNGDEAVCDRAADANDDGNLDIADVVFILNFLFNGGPEPLNNNIPPGNACDINKPEGDDINIDDLDLSPDQGSYIYCLARDSALWAKPIAIVDDNKECAVPILLPIGDSKLKYLGCGSDGRQDRVFYRSYVRCEDATDNFIFLPSKKLIKSKVMIGNPTPFSVFAGSGEDYIVGTDDIDFITGGKGNDIIFGMKGDDVLKGGSEILPLVVNFLIDNNDGTDILVGGDGDDHLAGNDEDNLLVGGKGKDSLYGGFFNSDIEKIENLRTKPSRIIFGGDGNDNIIGGYGDDWIYGGRNEPEGFLKELINGGKGDDLIFGDRDPLLAENIGETPYIDLSSIIKPNINGKEVYDTVKKKLEESPEYKAILDHQIPEGAVGGRDEIDAGYGNDVVFGEGGNDVIYGNKVSYDDKGKRIVRNDNDDDWLFGGSGNDAIEGGGKDSIDGSSMDVIYGDGDDDKLYGDEKMFKGNTDCNGRANDVDMVCGGKDFDTSFGDCRGEGASIGESDRLIAGPNRAGVPEVLAGLFGSDDDDSFYINPHDETDFAGKELLVRTKAWGAYKPAPGTFRGISDFYIILPDCEPKEEDEVARGDIGIFPTPTPTETPDEVARKGCDPVTEICCVRIRDPEKRAVCIEKDRSCESLESILDGEWYQGLPENCA